MSDVLPAILILIALTLAMLTLDLKSWPCP
jgi:hypothetical protein